MQSGHKMDTRRVRCANVKRAGQPKFSSPSSDFTLRGIYAERCPNTPRWLCDDPEGRLGRSILHQLYIQLLEALFVTGF